MNIGDRVKVIDQNITGTIIEDYGNKIVIEEDDCEYDDNRLEYRVSEVQLLKQFKVYASYTTQLDTIIEAIDEEDALNTAENLDGGSFKAREFGDWNIDSAIELKEAV